MNDLPKQLINLTVSITMSDVVFSADERKTAGSSSLMSTASSRMSSDKGKTSDERAFAVVSTPRPSQSTSDRLSAAQDVVDKQQVDRVDEVKPSVKVQPAVIHVTRDESSVTASQVPTRGQEDRLPAQSDRQQEQQEVKVDQKVVRLSAQSDRQQEQPEVKVDQKVVESSKPEPVTPVSRTDPAHLHKVISQRIEQSLSSKQEDSITTTTTTTTTAAATTTTTTHEVSTQNSKIPVEGTAASAADGVVQKEESVMQRAKLKESTKSLSTDERKVREAVEKTRTDVRRVRMVE